MTRMHAHPIKDDRRRARRSLVIQTGAFVLVVVLTVAFFTVYA